MIAPRIVPIVSVTGALGLILCAVLAWAMVRSDDAQRQRDCERTVAARDDSRAMWLYLVDDAKPTQQKRVDAFVAELNKRLPALKCDDGSPVPDKP